MTDEYDTNSIGNLTEVSCHGVTLSIHDNDHANIDIAPPGSRERPLRWNVQHLRELAMMFEHTADMIDDDSN